MQYFMLYIMQTKEIKIVVNKIEIQLSIHIYNTSDFSSVLSIILYLLYLLFILYILYIAMCSHFIFIMFTLYKEY